jgi:hypothetical protein
VNLKKVRKCMHAVTNILRSFSFVNYLRNIYGSADLLLKFGRFVTFLILYKVGRTPWTGDQPVARSLPTHRMAQTRNKRTQQRLEWDSSEDSSCLRPHGHCDRPLKYLHIEKYVLEIFFALLYRDPASRRRRRKGMSQI